MVGAQFNAGLAGSKAGAAYVFDRNQTGANQWGLSKRIAAVDGVSSASFGYAVAISGDLIIAGVPYDKTNSNRTGSAYVFARNQGGPGQWGQANKFLPFDGGDGDEFGFSVTIDGELMAITSHLDYDSSDGEFAGAVYLYARNYPGVAQWSLLEKLMPLHFDGDNNDAFAVSLSQSTLAVGTHGGSSSQSGAAYIYRLRFDNAPYLAQPIPDQLGVVNTPFTFAVPPGAFADPDAIDSLAVSLNPTPPLPAWLTFDPATAAFTGVPDVTGISPIVLTATDQEGASFTATFNINIMNAGATPAPPSAKVLWRNAYFTTEALTDPSLEATVWGDNADPDGDGVSNLQEYLFGTNPLQADPGDTSPVRIAPGLYTNTISITFRRRTNDPRLDYSLESSSGLANWQAVDSSLILEEADSPLSDSVEQATLQVQIAGADATPIPQLFRVTIYFLAPDLP